MTNFYKQLIQQGNYIGLNKALMKSIGRDESLLLSFILDFEGLREKQSEKVEEKYKRIDAQGYFDLGIDELEEESTFSKYEQAKTINSLEKLGLITSKLKGIPAKRNIKINQDFFEILEQLTDQEICNKKSKILTSGGQKIEQLAVKNSDNYTNTKSISKSITNIKENIKEKKLDLENIISLNLKSLEEYKQELLNNPDQSLFYANQKSQDQVWSTKKAKSNIISICETINEWIKTNPKKLTELPNIKSRFKKFAEKNEIGWIYPAKVQTTNYQSNDWRDKRTKYETPDELKGL